MSFPGFCRPLLRLQHHNAASIICHPQNVAVRGLSTHAPSPSLSESSSSSTFSAPAVDQKKPRHLSLPSRGGQDLAERYKRLERSIRGKTSYGRGIEDLHRSGGVEDPVPYTKEENVQESSLAAGKHTRRIYRGFVVPEAPKPPADDECCMSGCAICVYDLYDEARTDYIQVMDKLRVDLTKLGVPESEWPADIRGHGEGSDPAPASKPSISASLSAFEQLELALRAKREKGTSGSMIITREASSAPLGIRKRPPKKGLRMNDVVEGLRWILFSDR